MPKDKLETEIRDAIQYFWRSRKGALSDQQDRGVQDQGNRGAVTAGGHMDEFVNLLARNALVPGLSEDNIYVRGQRQLPGFFRPVKEWDLVIVRGRHLLVAMEVKSQVGSLGNNFNNRTEEAIGNGVDLFTAYREGAFGASPQPWAGYFMVLEDSSKSGRPVAVLEPHFKVFEDFREASYAKRYELLCWRLILERHYTAGALILSPQAAVDSGEYREPAKNLTLKKLIASMRGHLIGSLGEQP